MENKNSYHYRDRTLSYLLVAFIVLKLCGVINWSWWWVCSPIWIPIVLTIIVVGVGAALGAFGRIL